MSIIYSEILKILDARKQAVLITVIDKTGHGPAKPGFKMLITSEGKNFGTVGGGAIEHLSMKKALDVMKQSECSLNKYWLSEDDSIIADNPDFEKTGMMCGGTITLFFEPLGTSEKLYIIGAGHVGKALLYHLDKLDFNITIIDIRSEILNEINNTRINKILVEDYAKLFENEEIPKNAYFIVAAHSHELDYIVIKRIFQLKLHPKYIGALASRRKAEILKKQLKDEFYDSPDFSILHMPVGLNIGGTTPDEIALSISAQIQQYKYNKTDLRFEN